MWWKIRGPISKYFCIKKQGYSVRKWWKIRGPISKYLCIKKQGYSVRKVVEDSWSYH